MAWFQPEKLTCSLQFYFISRFFHKHKRIPLKCSRWLKMRGLSDAIAFKFPWSPVDPVSWIQIFARIRSHTESRSPLSCTHHKMETQIAHMIANNNSYMWHSPFIPERPLRPMNEWVTRASQFKHAFVEHNQNDLHVQVLWIAWFRINYQYCG